MEHVFQQDLAASAGEGRSRIAALKDREKSKVREQEEIRKKRMNKSRRALALTVTFRVRRYRKLINFGC